MGTSTLYDVSPTTQVKVVLKMFQKVVRNQQLTSVVFNTQSFNNLYKVQPQDLDLTLEILPRLQKSEKEINFLRFLIVSFFFWLHFFRHFLFNQF
jgi:hypothetical protein